MHRRHVHPRQLRVGADDAGTTGSPDATACVNIEVSKYPHGCNVDSDCVNVTPGVICTGQCACGGAAINTAGLAEYKQAIQSVQAADCPCVAPTPVPEPRCVQNECILCSSGSNSPGCPDGG